MARRRRHATRKVALAGCGLLAAAVFPAFKAKPRPIVRFVDFRLPIPHKSTKTKRAR